MPKIKSSFPPWNALDHLMVEQVTAKGLQKSPKPRMHHALTRKLDWVTPWGPFQLNYPTEAGFEKNPGFEVSLPRNT